MIERVTRSEAETEAVGAEFAASVEAGDVILLRGPLGAGKTAFVRGLARGLRCDLEGVSSPTFTIIQSYSGPVRVQHVDLYRLEPHEVDDLGLLDLGEDAVTAVEWAERWTRAPVDAIEVTIDPADGTERRLTIRKP